MDQLKEMEPFYEQVLQKENEYGIPVLEFFQNTLKSEEIVIFTDNTKRPIYKDMEKKFLKWEKKYKTVVLDHIPNSEDVSNFLRTVTKGVEPQHLFYKEKYFASSRILSRKFENGEIEDLFGMEPIVLA